MRSLSAAGGVRGKQIGRQPDQIDMAIGRDHVVSHRAAPRSAAAATGWRARRAAPRSARSRKSPIAGLAGFRRSGRSPCRGSGRAGPAGCTAPARRQRRGRQDRISSHGTDRNSRPAKSMPRKPPCSGWNFGMQPRCVQMPTSTRYSGIDRAMPVARVRRLLGGVRLGIEQQVQILLLLQHLERSRRAADDKNGPAPPYHLDLLARLDRRQVDIDRRAGRERVGRRVHRVDERPDRDRRPDGADRPGQQQQEVAARRVSARVSMPFVMSVIAMEPVAPRQVPSGLPNA